MQNDNDRPSSETVKTPTPPPGQNVKNLVTPGDDAADEAEAETNIEPDVANPSDAEAPEEANSPT